MTPEEIAALPEGSYYVIRTDEGFTAEGAEWLVMHRDAAHEDDWFAKTGSGATSEADARRTCAALNACANVPDEALTPGSVRQLCADALAAIDEGLEDYELGQRLRAVLRGEKREGG
jgi:hypothetical protein